MTEWRHGGAQDPDSETGACSMYGYRDFVVTCCRQGLLAMGLIAGSAVSHAQTPPHAVPGQLELSFVASDVHGASVTDAQSPVRVVPSLGAHTLLVQSEGLGASPAVTTPITTQPGGSSLIVLNGGYAENSGRPVDSYSNKWKQLGKSVVYNGYGGSFNVTAYVALAAKGGPNHTVSIVKGFDAAGEISVPFVEIRHAGVLQDVAQNYPATGLVLTSGSVTTTGPATLVAVWWGDGGVTHMTAVPDNGFAIIDSFLMLPDNSGVQCAVAFKQVSGAGTYQVSWVGSPLQGAILWLFAFQSR